MFDRLLNCLLECDSRATDNESTEGYILICKLLTKGNSIDMLKFFQSKAIKMLDKIYEETS